MSSQRKPAAAPGPPPERKAAAGPTITPQVLMVVYFLLLIVGVAMYYNMVIKKSQADIAAAVSEKQSADTQAATYRKKGAQLAVARELNQAVRDKLRTVAYAFMTDQSSLIPFWENTFFPILFSSRLQPGADSEIKVEPYTFMMNPAMSPFDTLPASNLFDDLENVFPIKYEGEKNGTPVESPLNTQPRDFLTPYTFSLIKFRGTYQDVKRFVEGLQVKQDKTLFTVHCMENHEDSNAGIYRTSTEWDIVLTVYFINPEAQASGDDPPGAPGSENC